MNMLTSLFDWFLAASLRASVLTLVVLVVQFLLQRHLSPRWRYALWLPVLAVLLMPVHPESRWSLETAFLPAAKAEAHAVALPPAAPVPLDLSVGEPMSAPVPVAAAAVIDWQQLGMLLWFVGCTGILLCSALSFSRVLLRFKASRQPVGEKLQALIEQTSQEVGLRRTPEVWIAPSIGSPAVTGLLRPTLLLPERFDHSFTLSEVRLILQHELTHLKRRDLPVNALLCLLMALHWFNPLLWVAFLKVRADREAACDAQVLHNAPHTRRVEYGHALLKVESAFSPLSLSLGFVGIFQRGAALRSRIRSIASQRQAHPVMNVLAALCMVLMTFFGVTRAESPNYTIGQTLFRPGDSIRLTSVLRTADMISVSVEYELGSTDEATMALYITSTNSDRVPTDPRQRVTVTKGRGIATLHYPKPIAGMPHVTFYDKTSGQGIGGIYFGTPEEAAQSKMMKLGYLEEPKGNPMSGFMQNKVRKIILPRVSFDKASLEEAIEFIRVKSREHDTTTTNEKLKGVPIILRKDNGGDASITLSLTDVPVEEALRYITELAGYKYRVEPYAVVVQRTDVPPRTVTSPGADKKQAPTGVVPPGNAGHIIIPDIKFNGATLEEAVEFIRIKSREFDPAKKGVNIILKMGEKSSTALITLDLKDVPLPDALRYVAELAGHTLTADAQAYVLKPKAD